MQTGSSNIASEQTKAALLAKASEGMREVLSTEIDIRDILPLIEGDKKLGGTLLDAILVKYQATAKEVVEKVHVKATEEYIRQAVRVNGQNMESLLARTVWVIPLCSEDSKRSPRHWVTAWVDWTQKKIGIFDSIPELGSSSWAEPLLIKIVDHIRKALGQDRIEWDADGWGRVIERPLNLECQMDSWSCGYYVLMRVRGFLEGNTFDKTSFTVRDAIRQEALDIVLGLPLKKRAFSTSTGALARDDDDDEDELELITADKRVQICLELGDADPEEDEEITTGEDAATAAMVAASPTQVELVGTEDDGGSKPAKSATRQT
ncbi:hypothetical protein CPC08DRAFT_729532 [Agrocybe pediades]|nr:hypothetical protein CPC08DRAFT_729532 [Agrocybe pediades]